MARKNALGRGLGALIEEQQGEEQNPVNELRTSFEISINEVEANPFQPREEFDEEALAELSSSIKEIGIVQPITVRQINNRKYQIIAGERRFRASKLAGLETIPAFVRKADDQAMLEMALVENIQREDLNSIEIALSYQRLIDECQLTQENLSGRVGKKRSTITNYLRLLKLPPAIQMGLQDKRLSMGHARALINIEDPEKQEEAFRQIVQKDLSVRQVEELVRKLNQPPKSTTNEKTDTESQENDFAELKQQLQQVFDTNIDFKRTNNGSGKIVIPFKSDNDLERIIGLLDQLNT
ncbi:MAG: ParB/RepB/Spo0J family partition protein [Bacteroidota bacterium]